MIAPLCFDPDAWKAWKYLARVSSIDPRWYCRDCTPEYKAKMLAIGRCGHPETVFGLFRTGFATDAEYVGVPKHIKVNLMRAA